MILLGHEGKKGLDGLPGFTGLPGNDKNQN